jgi:hypothetical protein
MGGEVRGGWKSLSPPPRWGLMGGEVRGGGKSLSPTPRWGTTSEVLPVLFGIRSSGGRKVPTWSPGIEGASCVRSAALRLTLQLIPESPDVIHQCGEVRGEGAGGKEGRRGRGAGSWEARCGGREVYQPNPPVGDHFRSPAGAVWNPSSGGRRDPTWSPGIERASCVRSAALRLTLLATLIDCYTDCYIDIYIYADPDCYPH